MGRKPRRKTADPKLAIAYIRVSTDKDRQANGLAAQRTEIIAWAAREGVTIVEWLDEEVSGGALLEDRPKLLAAIAAVSRHRAGILVVQKLDRFARDTDTAAQVGMELAKLGARVISAAGEANGDDPGSKMIRKILLAVAENEKAVIAARIRAGLKEKKARGELTGDAPYGFSVELGPLRRNHDGEMRPVKLLVPNPVEQETIRLAFELRPGRSLTELADMLAEMGRFNRRGGKFHKASLHKMTTPAK